MKETFGESLKQLRKDRNITLRSFAKIMGISASYLSDIENDRCMPPYKDKVSNFIEKVIKNLSLTDEEAENLYFLADKKLTEKFTIAHEIGHYLMSAPQAQLALRKAANKKSTNDTWDEIIKIIEKGDN